MKEALAPFRVDIFDDNDVHTIFSDSVEKYDLLNGINKLLFLFSGGKDATFGLTMLIEYLNTNNLDIDLDVLMITYPLHVYFNENGEKHSIYRETVDYWKKQNINLKIIEPDDDDLPDADKYGCHKCKNVRMDAVSDFILNNVALLNNTAIVTGYTLYDAHAYMQEFAAISNYTYDLEYIKDELMKIKVLNYLHKVQIKEFLTNGMRIVRPLLQFKEDDISKYLTENSIPFINVPCKVSEHKIKRQYFKILNKMGADLNISYSGLLDFLKLNGVKYPKNFNDISTIFNFTDC